MHFADENPDPLAMQIVNEPSMVIVVFKVTEEMWNVGHTVNR